MNLTIFDHMRDDAFLLLRRISSIGMSSCYSYMNNHKSLAFFNDKRGNIIKVFNDYVEMKWKQILQIYKFKIELTDPEIRENNRSLLLGDNTTYNFKMNYKRDRNILGYGISINSNPSELHFSFTFSNAFYNYITLLDGEVIDLSIANETITLRLNGDILRLVDMYKIIFNDKVNDSNIDLVLEKYNTLSNSKLIIEFHSNGKIRKIDNNEGFSYESNLNGNFILSCYSNSKLHGYYFNSYTNEQGFYQNGIKVGFWKERGEIKNYDNEEIFFIFPIFPF